MPNSITVAELILQLSALPDQDARVVKGAGPFDGWNDLAPINDGYLGRDMEPVQVAHPDAIHVVYL